MCRISEILKTLPKSQVQLLQHAFDHEDTYYLKLNETTFIGVHIKDEDKRFSITDKSGFWSTGEILC